MLRALPLYRPIDRMCRDRPATPSSSRAAGVAAAANSPAVALLTLLVRGLCREDHRHQQFEGRAVDAVRSSVPGWRAAGARRSRAAWRRSRRGPRGARAPPSSRRVRVGAPPRGAAGGRCAASKRARLSARPARPAALRPARSWMQSTGHGGDAQLAAGAVARRARCARIWRAPTMASTGQGARHRAQPMQRASSIQATWAAASTPLRRIERHGLPAEQLGERLDGGAAAGRALVDVGLACGDRVGVRSAARESRNACTASAAAARRCRSTSAAPGHFTRMPGARAGVRARAGTPPSPPGPAASTMPCESAEAHLARLQVRDDDDEAADQGRRVIGGADAGEDLRARPGRRGRPQLQQLVGARDRIRRRRYARREVDARKLVDGDLGRRRRGRPGAAAPPAAAGAAAAGAAAGRGRGRRRFDQRRDRPSGRGAWRAARRPRCARAEQRPATSSQRPIGLLRKRRGLAAISGSTGSR